jgi:hypothetical protein
MQLAIWFLGDLLILYKFAALLFLGIAGTISLMWGAIAGIDAGLRSHENPA